MPPLSTILGQPAAISLLSSAWRAGRLPHALIFAGPVGVGKATTASALASLFLCEKPAPGDNATPPHPCGKCKSCLIKPLNNHPDFRILIKEHIRLYDKTGESKATEFSIEVIRHELVAPASLKPSLGMGKVFIIEQAELLSNSAQNAALKTIEEPFGRTLIILLTHQPDSLLPTIRSRCRLIPFAPLPIPLVKKELEKRGLPPTDASDAATFSEGSLGLSLAWHHDGVLIHARELRDMLHKLTQGHGTPNLPEWLKSSAEEYTDKQVAKDEYASRNQMSRNALGIYFQIAAQFFRQLMSTTDTPATLDSACLAIDAITHAERHLDANVTIPLVYQELAVELESAFS